MVDDAVVLGLLWEIEEGCREHSCTPHDMSIDVEGDTLAALCRAWLAVDEAATGTVEAAGDDEAGQPRVLVHSTRDELAQGPSLACQRVRIVKEAGE